MNYLEGYYDGQKNKNNKENIVYLSLGILLGMSISYLLYNWK